MCAPPGKFLVNHIQLLIQKKGIVVLSRARSPHRVSLFQPYLRLTGIKLHHVNGADEIVVAERKVKLLYGFLLVPVPQGGVGSVRINPATHGIREPAVPEVVDRRFGVEARGFCRRSPASCQGVLVGKADVRTQ